MEKKNERFQKFCPSLNIISLIILNEDEMKRYCSRPALQGCYKSTKDFNHLTLRENITWAFFI